ncbi:hypothetical protein P4499_00215 [Geobacillus kaustophilus]|uniref:hypothetical protein n=1 Tax=Geobacillus kaustophilus TaxID=1462 RepID=UPI002E1B17A8|nr:hypothetical protein [Geobacillus kaustophilus]
MPINIFDFAASLGLDRYAISTASPQLDTDLIETAAFAKQQRRRIIKQYETIRCRCTQFLLVLFERGLEVRFFFFHNEHYFLKKEVDNPYVCLYN